MKKLFTLALALVALSSCNKEAIDSNAPVEVKMNAKIANTKAAINPGSAVQGVQFARWNGETADWISISAISITGEIATDGKITLSPTQYYQTDEKSHFVGFYPAATSVAAGVASMTITGNEDVLYATPVEGSKTSLLPAMTFNHQLSQFKFIVKKDASVAPDVTAVSVTIKDANTTFNMALLDGALSTWATPTAISVMTGKTATDAGYTENNVFMIEPGLSKIVLTVSADGYTTRDVEIDGSSDGKFLKGYAYEITLTFKPTTIEPTSAISKWEDGPATGGDIE